MLLVVHILQVVTALLSGPRRLALYKGPHEACGRRRGLHSATVGVAEGLVGVVCERVGVRRERRKNEDVRMVIPAKESE